MSLVSYVPKKGKNVVLISTLYRDGRICSQEHQKPDIIMDYNATKGGVDNLDKLVTGYSYKRRTLLWPLVIFFNISVYNVFVIWMALNPDWDRGKLRRRRLSRGAGQGCGKTSNTEKVTYPKDLSFCSHCEEDSGGCWCPIFLTHRTNNSNLGSDVVTCV